MKPCVGDHEHILKAAVFVFNGHRKGQNSKHLPSFSREKQLCDFFWVLQNCDGEKRKQVVTGFCHPKGGMTGRFMGIDPLEDTKIAA